MTMRNTNKSDTTEMREKREEGQLQRFYQNLHFTFYCLTIVANKNLFNESNINECIFKVTPILVHVIL